jgi:MraZ protein
VEIDRQGRMAIPAYLREFARLESAVLIVGALNRVELWSPTEWETRVLPSEAELTDETDTRPTAAEPVE